MKYANNFGSLAVVFMGIALIVSGCAGEKKTTTTGNDTQNTVSSDDHSGWWCVEHGVPEEECALCDKSLVSKFKEDGDWCDEHDRPESQCFICSPARFDKFAMRYEAKTGQKPPQPEE